jgi:putative endonuclease
MHETRTTLGERGEGAALDRYRRRGFALVARNWRCSLGELDLVVRRGDLLVFCEVKTRRPSAHGAGFEAVDARKQRKLRSLAEAFLLTTATHHVRVRFDVASVAMPPAGFGRRLPQVEIFDDAF